MDHAASLPYVLAKTPFAGRTYMTHPTKAIYKHLMQDSVRIANTHHSNRHVSKSDRLPSSSHANDSKFYSSNSGTDGYTSQLFTEADLLSTLPSIQTIAFHTTHTHAGITITPYPAGHVLGACMYLIEIAGLKILFTGDYSRETDRHLIPATIPPGLKVDCLITESTFGISTHIPRLERETALLKSVTGILNRGGRALLPVFAIGRAQELLLILEEYWASHPEYQHYPIYYASSLARKCMVVYQTYIDSMNTSIRSKFSASQSASTTTNAAGERKNGPWDFTFIRSLKSLDRFDDLGGCVMLASPGFMQNGVSRTLLERWCPDPRNGVVITGYSVEGTMAKQIMTEPDAIPAVMTNRTPGGPPKRSSDGAAGERTMIPRRCTVQEFSFAAHVDGQENREFIEEVGAEVVILVHGEKHNMARLKSRLLGSQPKGQAGGAGGGMKVYSPQNCEEVRIPFRRDKIARVVGRLASRVAPPHQSMLSPPASSEDGDEEEKEGKKRRRSSSQQQAAKDTIMTGVLVQNEHKLTLMDPSDLKEYAGLTTTTILCRQRIALAVAGPELVRWALEGMFGSVEVSTEKAKGKKGEDGEDEEDVTVFGVMGNAVRLLCLPRGQVEVEWEGNATNDAIADAVVAVLLTVESSPAAVRASSKPHTHTHQETLGRHPLATPTPSERLSRLFMFLEAQFGEDAITPLPLPRGDTGEDEVATAKELQRLHGLGIPVPGVEVRVDKLVARVWLEGLEVECASNGLEGRVRAVVERGVETVGGLW